MTPVQWAQLALGIVKLANWAAAKVDQATWKRLGYQQVMTDHLSAVAKSAGIARAIEAETRKMSPEEILRDLEGNGELRD